MVELHGAVQTEPHAKLEVGKPYARKNKRRVGMIKDRVLRVQVIRKAINLVDRVFLQIKNENGGNLLANHHLSEVSDV